jgi:hypothetical protein
MLSVFSFMNSLLPLFNCIYVLSMFAVCFNQHQDHRVALGVTSSGIASLLLDGDHTAHPHFKIPIPIFETSRCNIRMDSLFHDVLKQTGIIIWDKVPMQHKHAVKAVDQTLQDLLRSKNLLKALVLFLEVTSVRLSQLFQEVSGTKYWRLLSRTPSCGSMLRFTFFIKTYGTSWMLVLEETPT